MSKLCERRIWQYYQEKWIDFATGRENGMRKRVLINIIYGIGIGLFLSFFSETILENILVGPGWSKESDFFDLYGMICWLLIYSPIWGMNFIFLEDDLNLSNIVIARYGNIKKWWRRLIRNVIKKFKQPGKIVLLASHNREDIEILCDKVYRVQNGKVEKM